MKPGKTDFLSLDDKRVDELWCVWAGDTQMSGEFIVVRGIGLVFWFTALS